MNINVGLISLGCPKNLVDSEIMLGKLSLSNSKQYNYKIVNQPELADIIIINTCSFIDDAKKESIDTILEVIEYKKDKCKAVIVAGCLAQRYQNEILKEFPEIDAI
ncbi:MAG TPA: 30S ribosomal protein S12 methylthiotransferase RimO, partial [Clostridia bacterium]|nr:30S ribosomal protein S12 methylthiotransferase RimO [Clostridia bacterium]